jgi:hypothetical protein
MSSDGGRSRATRPAEEWGTGARGPEVERHVCFPPRPGRLGDSMTSLRAATLLYLGLPQIIFLASWVRPLYGWPAIALIMIGLASARRRPRGDDPSPGGSPARPSAHHLVIGCLPAIAIGLLCGAGGWGHQDPDWPKHNAIFRDLVHATWPIIYHHEGHPLLLTYYIAYYLPAALVGKLAGWWVANHVLALYTIVGLCLAGMWVVRLTGLHQWWVVPLFLAFSGMDVIGQTLWNLDRILGFGLLPRGGGWAHIEWWAGPRFAQYSGMSTLIMFVPNQAIAGWLLTALVAADTRAHRLWQTGGLHLGISVLWSPFVTLGLGPMILASLVSAARRFAPSDSIVGSALTPANLAGAVIGLLTVSYLFARFHAHPLPVDVGGLPSTRLSLQSGDPLLLLRYLLFVLLEFAFLHALLHAHLALRATRELRPLWLLLAVATVSLLALPFFRYGFNNDLVMRASIPALFMTALTALIVVGDVHPRAVSPAAFGLRRAVLAVLLIGSVTSAIEIGRHLHHVYQRNQLVAIPDPNEIMSLMQLQKDLYNEKYNFIGQYMGSAASFFMVYLANGAKYYESSNAEE